MIPPSGVVGFIKQVRGSSGLLWRRNIRRWKSRRWSIRRRNTEDGVSGEGISGKGVVRIKE